MRTLCLVLKSMLKWISLGVPIVLAVAGLFFLLHPGYQLGRGVWHLLTPFPKPVVANPPMAEVSRHRVSWVADLADLRLHESSGLAASNRHAGIFWSMNDSGNQPELFALNLHGKTQGVLKVNTQYHDDWEALDAFELDGVAYLVIANSGDNFRWRSQRTLLVVAEPELTMLTAPDEEPVHIDVAWQIHFTYPDGPRDAEAMAVDSLRNRILIISKRETPPTLYSLPLRASQPVIATPEFDLVHLPRPTREEVHLDRRAYYRHMPSGMDIAQNSLLLTTYKDAYLYNLSEVSPRPLRVPLPSLGQREALSFGHDSDRVAYVTRERLDGVGFADLFKIELLDVSAKMPEVAVQDTP